MLGIAGERATAEGGNIKLDIVAKKKLRLVAITPALLVATGSKPMPNYSPSSVMLASKSSRLRNFLHNLSKGKKRFV